MEPIGNAGAEILSPSLWEKYEGDFRTFFQVGTIPNCSEYVTEQPQKACFSSRCFEEQCIVCLTPDIQSCCYCYGCPECLPWSMSWQMTTAVQVSIFLLFILGIMSVIGMYLKACSSAAQISSEDQAALQNACNDQCTNSTPQRCVPQNLRDRPPSYSEACSAPPLYTCPYNRVSMLEAPPVYPTTPIVSKRNSQSPDSVPAVVQHI